MYFWYQMTNENREGQYRKSKERNPEAPDTDPIRLYFPRASYSKNYEVGLSSMQKILFLLQRKVTRPMM